MEPVQPQVFSPSLKKVLKNYQTVAMSTLQGPSGLPARWIDQAVIPTSPDDESYNKGQGLEMKKTTVEKYLEEAIFHPPPFPIQQIPVLTPLDQSRSERSETILEGETISCFIVGGEKRLCLPQILNSVLRDFSLQQINSVCDDLHIYCSRCNPEQLEVLKIMSILPFSAPSCGLITKTDSERLCNALLHTVAADDKIVDKPTTSENSYKVHHECFGKCKGIFTPELYTSSHAKCIICVDCQGMFTPQRFVCHAHKSLENRTCHWGFDSANWRSYLLLAKDQDIDKYQDALEEMKAKFDFVGRYKRKPSPIDELCAKKARGNGLCRKVVGHDAIVTSGVWLGGPHPVVTPIHRLSAFRPWSPATLAKEAKMKEMEQAALMRDSRFVAPPYLSSGPPILLNPDRVIPHTTMTNVRFDAHYQPNVALAPAATQRKQAAVQDDKLKIESMSEENVAKTEEKSDDVDLKNCEMNEIEKEDDAASLAVMTVRIKEEPQSSIEMTVDSTVEQEMEIVRNALENNALDSKEAKEKLLHELAKLRIKQEERLNAALVAKKSLQQELEFLRVAKKEKLREATEAKRSLRKEIERLRADHERKLKEVNESRHRLKRELELARSKRCDKISEISKSKARLKSQVEQLRNKLNEVENEKEKLSAELENEKKLRDGLEVKTFRENEEEVKEEEKETKVVDKDNE